MIRALLKQKMKYREISKICGCSHRAINSERKVMLAEEAKPEEKNTPEGGGKKPTLTLLYGDRKAQESWLRFAQAKNTSLSIQSRA